MSDASSGTPFLADARALTELEDWGQLAEATGEPMFASGVILHTDEESGAETGVWQCTPGPSRWEQDKHEFVHILSGSMTVHPDGAEPFEAGPGSTFVVPKGWRGNWLIHETLRKVYVIY
jgi:uncharacterized cupin superfamily protein